MEGCRCEEIPPRTKELPETPSLNGDEETGTNGPNVLARPLGAPVAVGNQGTLILRQN